MQRKNRANCCIYRETCERAQGVPFAGHRPELDHLEFAKGIRDMGTWRAGSNVRGRPEVLQHHS